MNNNITANFYPGKCPGMPVCSYATANDINSLLYRGQCILN